MDARAWRAPRSLRQSGAARAVAVVTALLAASCGGERRDEPAPAARVDTVAIDTLPERASVEAADTASPARVATTGRACRCVERPLSAYFGEADVVVLGRLIDARGSDRDLLLDLALSEQPWKRVVGDRSAGSGDVVTVTTDASSSSCGIPLRPGALYVVFARSSGRGPRIDPCGGTRVLPADGSTASVFEGVRADSLVARLDALSGLEVQRSAAVNAPDPSDWDNESLIGLVELPALNSGEVVPVRPLPDATSEVDRVIDSWVDVATSEVAYEVPAAVVATRADDWYRIGLADGSFGWVAPLDAGAWTPFERLPLDALAYLTEAWSGHLWPQAGGGVPVRSRRKGTQQRGEYAAQVHEARWLGSALWFRVDVLTGSPCDGGDVDVEASGWVLAYGADGDPAVWYYSRGC